MSVMDAIRRFFHREHGVSCDERECQAARIVAVDQRLHDQTARLHVREWKADPEIEERRRRMDDEHAVIMHERENGR